MFAATEGVEFVALVLRLSPKVFVSRNAQTHSEGSSINVCSRTTTR